VAITKTGQPADSKSVAVINGVGSVRSLCHSVSLDSIFNSAAATTSV